MSLGVRRNWLGFGIDKDRLDYTVYTSRTAPQAGYR